MASILPKPAPKKKESCCWCPKTCITCLVFLILLLMAALGYGYFFIYAEKEDEFNDLQLRYDEKLEVIEQLHSEKDESEG